MDNELELLLKSFKKIANEEGEFTRGALMANESVAKDYIRKVEKLRIMGKLEIIEAYADGMNVSVSGKIRERK
ncbi:hypothetical protein [Amphibacillus xylanus]|uniref:Uncharacterized protein n=1 Tax=Amphibacillus xylanus (strain ATCC 51415 / DSM 6626 / JCM 7361 / LMG 17667 / NBRC 15112 / Ep01) TaxID=698758 RepID=K0J5U1_AMPXN|nr:hypothetical protein [Amphibacillus xylanus]BAM46333.1 hypothetical protein AXY_02010 [Amphibacillus xylanus NBRC 15112]